MNKGTPADPTELTAFEKWAEDQPLMAGGPFDLIRGESGHFYRNQRTRDAWDGWQARAARAALATKPAETDKVKRMQDAIEGECDGLAITPEQARAILGYVEGHPTESAGKSPEAAGENRATDLMTRYRWAVQAGEVNEEYRQARDALYVALTETQRSSNATRSDDHDDHKKTTGSGVGAVQPPAPDEEVDPFAEPPAFTAWWRLANRPYHWTQTRLVALHAWNAALAGVQPPAPEPRDLLSVLEWAVEKAEDNLRTVARSHILGGCGAGNAEEAESWLNLCRATLAQRGADDAKSHQCAELKALRAQRGAALTDEQRTILHQGADELEQKADEYDAHGCNSAAEGCMASAFVIRALALSPEDAGKPEVR